ncbi:hypothetical protein DPMN_152893 [Dreissena polymorpha]|uniref:Uncharacterized protein n=1 Tax=Dreissena polymorpha TaxID=45954 RepID=A0A9D4FJ47_DREPO|nr:hypothetical protein DPMN_152893 [Dreissena polymorpha]
MRLLKRILQIIKKRKRLWYCLMWSQFNRENEWTPRTITRIQDIVSHRITQSHDTFQAQLLPWSSTVGVNKPSFQQQNCYLTLMHCIPIRKVSRFR